MARFYQSVPHDLPNPKAQTFSFLAIRSPPRKRIVVVEQIRINGLGYTLTRRR
jgi:hypothetical protein